MYINISLIIGINKCIHMIVDGQSPIFQNIYNLVGENQQ